MTKKKKKGFSQDFPVRIGPVQKDHLIHLRFSLEIILLLTQTFLEDWQIRLPIFITKILDTGMILGLPLTELQRKEPQDLNCIKSKAKLSTELLI